MNRYVLCRPRGGLHDQLCSVGDCLQYCQSFDRQLLIDARFSGLYDTIWRYFEPTNHHRIFDAKVSYADLNELSVFPKEVEGRLSTLQAQLFDGDYFISDKATRTPLTFSFEIDHQEAVLVHEQGRLGHRDPHASVFLHAVRLRGWLSKIIMARLAELPSEYAALHVRHTDYRVRDVESKLRSICLALPDGIDVLICSDNEEIFDISKSIFGSRKVKRFSTQVSMDGNPIHSRPAPQDQIRLNVETFADLFGLANASIKFFLPVSCEMQTGQHIEINSGFSLLANLIGTNRKLFDQLVYSSTQS